MTQESLLPPETSMPWSRLCEAGWRLKHLSHARAGVIDIILKKDDQIMSISGPDAPELWLKLEVKAGIEKRTALPKKEVTKADPRHTPFINEWMHAYLEGFGRKYVFNGAADATQLKRLLQSTDKSIEQLIEVAKEAWAASTAKFAKDTKRASTIAGFCSGWNEINAELDRMYRSANADTTQTL